MDAEPYAFQNPYADDDPPLKHRTSDGGQYLSSFDDLGLGKLLAQSLEPKDRHYDEAEAAAYLAHPARFAHGKLFNHAGLIARTGPNLHRELAEDGEVTFTDSRKVYVGPFHDQGGEPTCAVWATVNGLLAMGIEPAPATVRDLLNQALPRQRNQKDGLGVYAIEEFIEQHSELGVALHISALSGSDSPRSIARLLKTALDSGSVVYTSIQSGETGHAICISGYDITDGRMALQCLDSNYQGECLKSLDQLLAEIGKGSVPFAVMGRPEALDSLRSPALGKGGLFGAILSQRRQPARFARQTRSE